MSMADMRKEMDTLRDDNDMYAHEIKRYSKKMDEMELEVCLSSVLNITGLSWFSTRLQDVQARHDYAN